MTIKPFAIQGADLTLGGVNLQAGATTIVIPGVTQATNYFVEEVDERDGNNPSIFGSNAGAVTVIDNSRWLSITTGDNAPSADYVAATYSVDELDDGEIEEINVETEGVFLAADKARAEASNMWATLQPTPFTGFNSANWQQIPFRPKMRAGAVENVGGGGGTTLPSQSGQTGKFLKTNGSALSWDTPAGGEGLPTITVPAEAGTAYKGLQVSYGMVHSNSGSNELNVNKIVIHKPAVTTTSIDPTSSQDDFQVSGLSDSDVLALFVLYGNVNGPKSLSTLRAFAEAAIDNVVLAGGVEDDYNTVDEMKTAFYDNINTLTTAANGLYTEFKFYTDNIDTTTGITTVRQGSGAEFTIDKSGPVPSLEIGTITVEVAVGGAAGYSSTLHGSPVGSKASAIILDCYYEPPFILGPSTLIRLAPGSYSGLTVAADGTVGSDTVNAQSFTVGGVTAMLTPWQDTGNFQYSYVAAGDVFNLTNKDTETLAVSFGTETAGAYSIGAITNGGVNYLAGHEILVLGTDLGGATPDNDAIITVDEDGSEEFTQLDNYGVDFLNNGESSTVLTNISQTLATAIQNNAAVGKSIRFDLTAPGGFPFITTITSSSVDIENGSGLVVFSPAYRGDTWPIESLTITERTITAVSISGTPAGTAAVYTAVTGSNYNVGNGLTIDNIQKFNDGSTSVGIDLTSALNYVAGDIITLPGSEVRGVSPDNDIVIAMIAFSNNGNASYQYDFEFPIVFPIDQISDGGQDQYDGANELNTNFASRIGYNNGETVLDSTAQFGPGSSYCTVYQPGIFGLLVTGNSSTRISTSGGSGADGSSITEAGNIYGPDIAEQIFDNAVTHINIVSNPYAGPLITFTRTDYGDEVDEVSEGLHITKNDQGWLYNDLEDGGDHGSNTPTGSRWNNDGWEDFTDVESRTYTSLSDIWNGNFQNIPGAKMVMLDETTDKYWAIEFLSWTNGGNGGGASYTRRELNLTSVATGIRFPDGTRLTSAENVGRVKLTSPGSRRIEEVHGFKTVSVTGRTTGNTITTTAQSSNSGSTWQVNINAADTAFSDLIALTNLNGVYVVQVSADQNSWVDGYVGGNNGSTTVQIVFNNGATLAFDGDATVYYRLVTGGDPVVWWSSADLPSGNANFRGAVIDYHAYTGDGTWIGTIHIVDDDGEENITHTEVSSGGTDMDNDDLWLVTNEGQIKYRRIDGAGRTLKVQWTAKVFYGSEIYD